MQHSRRFAAAALAVTVGAGVALLPVAGPAQAAQAAPAAVAAPAKPTARPRVSWLAPARDVFSASSVWKTPVVRAPLNRRSVAMTRQLTQQVHAYYGGTAAFNAYQYNVSFVTVPRGQRRVTVAWNNCQHKDYTPAGLTGSGGVLTGVPIPPKTHPADGTDGELTIYSPATDQLWELWEAQQDASGRWSACWGGRIDHASTSRGWFDNGFGASASGLVISGGMVSFADMRRGFINHALSLAIPNPASWDDVSWPAQRSDGSPTTTSIIPEGTRFRLAANVNLSKLHLTPLALLIARAAKRYGFIVTDMSGAVSVTGESGTNLRWRAGANPWDRLLGSTPAYLQLKNFPWGRLQALPKNWGEPR